MLDFIDYETDDDGDLVIDSTGDIKVATAQRTVIQDALYRIRTSYYSYEGSPAFGSNISSLIGKPNNSETANKVVYLVQRALAGDGRFPLDEIDVSTVPVSPSKLALVVRFGYLPNTSSPTSLAATLNYNTGTIEMIAGPEQQGSGAS